MFKSLVLLSELLHAWLDHVCFALEGLILFVLWGEKQNKMERKRTCVKERNAHISRWSWVMCLYALGRRRLFFFILSTLDALYGLYSFFFFFFFFSFLIFIYYSSMPQRSFLSLSPAVPSPLYSLDRIYLFLPITARQSISSLIYVDIVWIIALPQTLQTNV